MSDRTLAQKANLALYSGLKQHFQPLAPPNLTAILSSIEDAYNSLTSKIESLDYCERVIRSIDWAKFWGLQTQVAPNAYELTNIADGLFSLSLNGEEALALMFVVFEHFASCAKNLSDVLAVLLNELWGLGLRGARINLGSVNAGARQVNRLHPLVTLIDAVYGDQSSWLNVATNIRNKTQHRDSTTILTVPVGRKSTEPPYVDSSLFPSGTTLERRLDFFCPWVKNQAFRFIEDFSRVAVSNPKLW